jgi:BCD family chlorophyll transporter-like MFS transporter
MPVAARGRMVHPVYRRVAEATFGLRRHGAAAAARRPAARISYHGARRGASPGRDRGRPTIARGDRMPLGSLLRLGLRQFAAGMLSVLALGILNRVMKVEMGVELAVVGGIIGAHYFTAPIAIPIGHQSDFRPYFGLHRTPYILAGAALTAAATVLAPFAAFLIRAQGGTPPALLAGLAVFLAMGAGIYTAGTAYLSLIADLTDERERGRAVSIIWSMLMLGILAGVLVGVLVLDHYSDARLVALCTGTAATLLLLTVLAVWGQERRAAARPSAEALTLPQAVRLLAAGRQTRRFFAFLCGGILFLFLQQVVLEPFGGDVFALSVRQTTAFNAYQMVGVLAGMGLAGAWLVRRVGTRATAALGLALAGAAFVLLALAAAGEALALVRPAILLMGVGMGAFNVGGLALMMGMAAAGRVGLYMGAWTLAQALANGLATAGGGVLYQVARALLGTDAAAYAAVFAVEAAGLALTLLLLLRIDVDAFRHDEARAERAILTER